MGKRWVVAVAIVGTVLLAPTGNANAKLPPWTCELSTTRPVVHERVRIEVRFWWFPRPGDPPHTRLDRSMRIRALPGFIVASSDSSGGPGFPSLHAAVRLVEPGVYEAMLAFPDTSRYRIERAARSSTSMGIRRTPCSCSPSL